MRSLAIVAARIGCILMVLSPASVAMAQDRVAMAAGRRPQFLVATRPSQRPVPVDAASVPALRRRVSLNLQNVSRADALEAISRASGLRFVYADGAALGTDRVRLKVDSITVAAALTEVLLDAGVDVLLARSGDAVLVKQTAVRIPASGSVVGSVTDSQTARGVAAAEVFLDGTSWRTTTDSVGRYHLVAVDTGTYRLKVRRLGYAKQSRTVTVREGQTDTVNVTLMSVVTRLDELVTTATGRRRRLELGNDITTLNADSIVRTQPITSVTDLLEGRVPGLVVQRTSGAPGDPARLRLRGAGSPLRSNDPIVVVDGVRVLPSNPRPAALTWPAWATPPVRPRTCTPRRRHSTTSIPKALRRSR
jgi:hypothetical protein